MGQEEAGGGSIRSNNNKESRPHDLQSPAVVVVAGVLISNCETQSWLESQRWISLPGPRSAEAIRPFHSGASGSRVRPARAARRPPPPSLRPCRLRRSDGGRRRRGARAGGRRGPARRGGRSLPLRPCAHETRAELRTPGGSSGVRRRRPRARLMAGATPARCALAFWVAERGAGRPPAGRRPPATPPPPPPTLSAPPPPRRWLGWAGA